MRPLPGAHGSAHSGGGAVRDEDNDMTTPMPNPMSCYITTEAALDAASDTSSGPHFRPSFYRRKRSVDNMSGRPARNHSRLPSPAPTSASLASLSSSALDLDLEPGTPHCLSPEVSPMRAGLSSVSVISSVSSRRHSVTTSSHSPRDGVYDQMRRDGDSQLIMPSLSVPQRRPFSTPGKSMGKLKILVAGPPGTGKTAILQAISQCCEHIVHMDPFVPSLAGTMNEVYASTRPRPWWQSQVEHGSSSTRRFSSSEILDRNLCFVVRSAHQHPSPSMKDEMNYVTSHLQPVLEKPLDDSDLWDLLTNGRQSNVDAVLFMVPHTGLTQRDIDFVKAVQGKTNVLPLLSRVDELDVAEISRCKEHIRQQIQQNNLDCFSFSGPESTNDGATMDIFAVSSSTKPDYDVIDASILMDSAYIPPLVPTELAHLMQSICSEEGSAWLRQSAASKCIKWRRDHPGDFIPYASNTALTFRDPAKCALSPVLTVNPFGDRRFWHRVEVADWAEGLRRSLEAEKFLELTQQAQEVEAIRQWKSRELVRRRTRGPGRPNSRRFAPNLIHQDPLGVLHLASQLRRKGRMVLELLSSLGLLGCFAALMTGSDQPAWRGARGCAYDVRWWWFI